MRIEGTFVVKDFKPAGFQPALHISTGLPTDVWTMTKVFSGDIEGQSATIFVAAFDRQAGQGTYVAMESFQGTLLGRTGALNFVHSAATTGKDRTNEFFSIVSGSGTDRLQGISGTGGLTVDADAIHRIWFDCVFDC